MKKCEAARYCGLSISSFDRAIEAGEFPEGQLRAGGKFWLRQTLEDAMVDRDNVIQHDFGRPI